MIYGKNNTKDLKFLTMRIDKESHAQIKAAAALRNISIRKFLMRLIEVALLKEKERQ